MTADVRGSGSRTGEGAPKPSLREALRRARIEAADRMATVVDMRHAELARLEILHEALSPVLAEVPPGVDIFDVGVVPGEPPRLFLDMIAFVEMGRDKRRYRFIQDTRYGRNVVAESDDVAAIAAAVTTYVARRLVERERILAGSDLAAELAPQPGPAAAAEPAEPKKPAPPEPVPPPEEPRRTGPMMAFVVGIIVGGAVVVLYALNTVGGLPVPF